MEKVIQEFIQILIKENQWLDKLIEFGEEKKRIIILGKVQELDKLVQKEGIIVSTLEKLEGARFKLQATLAQAWNMSVNELTVGTMLEKSADAFPLRQDELKEEIERMQKTIVKLQNVNTENNELINLSLDYIENMQALFNDDVAGTYGENGMQSDEKDNRPINRLIDKKV